MAKLGTYYEVYIDDEVTFPDVTEDELTDGLQGDMEGEAHKIRTVVATAIVNYNTDLVRVTPVSFSVAED